MHRTENTSSKQPAKRTEKATWALKPSPLGHSTKKDNQRVRVVRVEQFAPSTARVTTNLCGATRPNATDNGEGDVHDNNGGDKDDRLPRRFPLPLCIRHRNSPQLRGHSVAA